MPKPGEHFNKCYVVIRVRYQRFEFFHVDRFKYFVISGHRAQLANVLKEINENQWFSLEKHGFLMIL